MFYHNGQKLDKNHLAYLLVNKDITMFKLITTCLSLMLTVVFWVAPALAQSGGVTLLKQERNGASTQKLTAGELASLGDPLFNLVLKDHADVTNLSEIENLIKGEEKTFVVDERIADPSPGQSRRAVLTFDGNNGGALKPNIMFSVGFNSERFPDVQPIEALGWDAKRSRYNYYKLDEEGTPGQLSWKFRGSSDGADTLKIQQREGTCMQCHINGAPVMKELLFPWDNWHSFMSQVAYLKSTNPWKVTSNDRIGKHLKGAEDLETDFIVPAINQFNTQRIEVSLARNNDGSPVLDSDGMKQVIEGKRLLRPLFVTTEFNIISSPQKVGKLHPFSDAPTVGPDKAVEIPESFFLNANLISDTPPGLGMAREVQAFREFTVQPEEYKQLLTNSGVQVNGQKPGDADFAWLVPEPSHIDNNMVEQLMQQGIVTPQFVAAVIAIDLETPILSKEREALLQFIPEQFRFQPLDGGANPLSLKRHPDDLTQKVVAAMEKASPESNSPAGKFLTLLKSDIPSATLKEQLNAYHFRVKQALDNQITRPAELERLYNLAIARREAVLEEGTGLKALDEFSLLFPLPERRSGT